jgi:hypothetical protein
MKNLINLQTATSLALIILAGCKCNDKASGNPFGADVLTVQYLDVNYQTTPSPVCGAPEASQTFDLYVPMTSLPGNAPKPLVIYVHGGGFVSKGPVPDNLKTELAKILEHGWAVALVNYRLLDLNLDCASETCGVRDKCMDDVVRCLKFIKSQAGAYGIDPNRVGLTGSSAGGTTCQWIAFKGFDEWTAGNTNHFGDPLIDAQNTDVKAVVSLLSQATLDLEKWDTEVFKGDLGTQDLNLTSLLATLTNGKPCYAHAIYGMGNTFPAPITLVNTLAYRESVEILDLLTALPTSSYNIPNLFIINQNENDDLIAPPGSELINHHPLHAVRLVDVAKANVYPNDKLFYFIPKIPAYTYNGGYNSIADFFFAKL